MKRAMAPEAPVGKLPAGASITGFLKTVHPPTADDVTKQPIVLTYPGTDLELKANLYGEHIHLSVDKCGKVVTITSQKVGALYMSKFDDGRRFLTVRDGVTYEFRDPKPGSVPTVGDRLTVLSQHYIRCAAAFEEACKEHDIIYVEEEASAAVLAIWHDTKHQAEPFPAPDVAQEKPEPSRPAPTPKPEPDVTEPEPEPEPEPKPPEVPKPTQAMINKLVALPLKQLGQKAVKALTYRGDSIPHLQGALAITEAIDHHCAVETPVFGNKNPWVYISSLIYDSLSTRDKVAMDEFTDSIIELTSNSGKPEWHVDRAVCMTISDKLRDEVTV